MPISVTVRDLLAGGAPRQAALPEPVATIGRNATCDLVLDDADKHVSRLHATVELRQDGHYLVVNSKINPILVDGVPCQPGTTAPLRDGAVIGMHPFELTVRIERAAARAAAPLSDTFGWVDQGLPAAAGESDPFGLNLRPAQAPRAAAAALPDLFRQAAPAQSSALVAGLGSGASAFDTPASLDPLALLGGANAAPFASVSGSAAPALVDFGGHQRATGSSALDHVHDFNLPFNAPAAPGPAPAAPAAFAGNDSSLDWLDQLTPGGAPAPAPAPPAVAPAPSPAAPAASVAPSPVAPAASAAPARAALLTGAGEAGAQGAPAAAAAPAPAPSRAGQHDGAALAAFLRGLGGAAFKVPPEQEQEFFEKAGEVVQVAVQGLVTLLLARGEIKKELRAEERTMLAARANNPLKFMGSAEEALRFLFDPGAANAAAFLAPTKAVEDACGELVAHELALVAGMRAAVIGAIRRFDPEAIEQKGGKAGGLIAMQRKARLWELYVEQYARLEAEMADNLDRLFERDFLTAYTDQVRRMAHK